MADTRHAPQGGCAGVSPHAGSDAPSRRPPRRRRRGPPPGMSRRRARGAPGAALARAARPVRSLPRLAAVLLLSPWSSALRPAVADPRAAFERHVEGLLQQVESQEATIAGLERQLGRCRSPTDAVPRDAVPQEVSLHTLNCEGAPFDPLWSTLRQRLDDDLPPPALSGLRRLQQGGDVALPAISPELLHLARSLGSACLAPAYNFIVGADCLYWNLTGGRGATPGGPPPGGGDELGRLCAEGAGEPRPAQRWWVDPQLDLATDADADSDGGAFCVYGCMAAHVVLALGALTQGLSEHNARAAVEQLETAEALLGRGELLAFASSSAWGAVPGLASVLLDFLLQRATPEARQGPTALELAASVRPCDPILTEDCWPEPSGWLESDAPVLVTVLGDHLPFARNGVDLMSAAAARLGLRLDFALVGQYYLCQDMPGACAPDDPVQAFLHAWTTGRWSSPDAGLPGDVAGELLAALRAHPRPRAANPDLLLCMSTPVICWLLRRRGSGPRAPALSLLDHSLLGCVPPAWQREVMEDFREWWGQRDLGKDVIAAHEEHFMLQVKWQTGVGLPFVPTVGVAFRSGAVYDLPDAAAGAERSVLALRSSFWDLPAGRTFLALLERFAAASFGTLRTRIRRLGPYTYLEGKGEGKGGTGAEPAEPVRWASFQEMARHTCALDVPAELSQLKFRDAYGMGLPIIVPEPSWLLRLLAQVYKGGAANQIHAELAASLEEPPPWPHAPFYDPARDPLARLEYWMPLADHRRYPHVAYFDSLPGLLRQVASTDWPQVSI